MAKKSLRELNLTHSASGHLISVYYPPHYKWNGSQSPVLLIGGVHGDEPEGVALVEQFLDWCDQKCLDLDKKNALKKTVPWLIITCLNPDGYKANPQERTNSNGVDLNRNFPSSDWSADVRAPRYNPGSKPNSESEVKALVALIETEKPKLIIHCHSYSPACVIFTGEKGKYAADVLAKSSGYPAKPDIGYPTPGSLGQYAGADRSIPVICVEEAEGVEPQKIWQHFGPGLSELFLEGIERSAGKNAP